MRWEHVRDGALNILYGKTEKARRTIPMTHRVAAQLDMRQTDAASEWVFPAPTATGHIEKSTLKKQHKKALAAAKEEPFTLYTFRHTCLTRWAACSAPGSLDTTLFTLLPPESTPAGLGPASGTPAFQSATAGCTSR